MDKATKILRFATAMIMAVVAGMDLAKRLREHAQEAAQEAVGGAGIKADGDPVASVQEALDRMAANLKTSTGRPRPKYRPKDPPADLDTAPWDDPKTRDRA